MNLIITEIQFLCAGSEMAMWQNYQQYQSFSSGTGQEKYVFYSNSCNTPYRPKQKVHPTKRPGIFNCPNCGKFYRYLRNMKNHVKLECGKDPRFQCPYCTHRSKQRGNLYQHIRTNHPGKKVYCNE